MLIKLTVKTTKKNEVVNITENLNKLLRSENIINGICLISVLHTTTAITTADLDPGTDLDMLDAYNTMIPKLKYRHPHNPEHVPDHILSTLIGTSLTLAVENDQLLLGTWQKVVLFEFDGPQERIIAVTLIKLP